MDQKSLLTAEIIRKKKFTIMLCGVLLYFLTCMAKLLIPGIIFNDLQKIGLDTRMIAGTGAAFMYAYALSQLLAGVFSNRYGGVRILLIGGTLFAVGTTAFPWTANYPLMIFFRVVTGLGAGTVFLGVVKLVNDLFSAKFALVLGTVMLCSYFGPVCGTTPMVLLVKYTSWQWAMTIPGIIALAGIAVILTQIRGTIRATASGNALKLLLLMLKNVEMWKLCIFSPVIFGIYYIISSQLGQKILTDQCEMTPEGASTIIMTLTVIVALNNVAGNFVLRLCGNRKKLFCIYSFLLTLAGSAIGFFIFRTTASIIATAASFILIAIPAGFFPIFSAAAKELNPPEDTGLAVALLNFWCFIFIAGFQNISGRILQQYAISGSLSYPPAAYSAVFAFMSIASICGLLMCAFWKKLPVKS